ncbi:hypothetical protein JTB14_029300 [Gonioctena quinquepunctata]|nr:hypothetical protein JTB14_029300 [Gonioctena quinquepunctata]
MTGVEKNCLFSTIFCSLDLLNMDLDKEKVLKSWDLEELVYLCKGMVRNRQGKTSKGLLLEDDMEAAVEMVMNGNSSRRAAELKNVGPPVEDYRQVAYEMAVMNKIPCLISWGEKKIAGINWAYDFLKRFRKKWDTSLKEGAASLEKEAASLEEGAASLEEEAAAKHTVIGASIQ